MSGVGVRDERHHTDQFGCATGTPPEPEAERGWLRLEPSSGGQLCLLDKKVEFSNLLQRNSLLVTHRQPEECTSVPGSWAIMTPIKLSRGVPLSSGGAGQV